MSEVHLDDYTLLEIPQAEPPQTSARAEKQAESPPEPKKAKAAPKKRAARVPPCRLVIELLGRRGYARKLWRPTALRLFREALRAESRRKRVPVVRIAEFTVEQPGIVSVRFAYRKAGKRVITPPHVVRVSWEQPT